MEYKEFFELIGVRSLNKRMRINLKNIALIDKLIIVEVNILIKHIVLFSLPCQILTFSHYYFIKPLIFHILFLGIIIALYKPNTISSYQRNLSFIMIYDMMV